MTDDERAAVIREVAAWCGASGDIYLEQAEGWILDHFLPPPPKPAPVPLENWGIEPAGAYSARPGDWWVYGVCAWLMWGLGAITGVSIVATVHHVRAALRTLRGDK